MITYVQSRYDLLTGRPGVRVILPDPIKFFYVYGSRRSGRTTYLFNDLLEYSMHNKKGTGFFSSLKSKSIKIAQDVNIPNVCFDSHFSLLGYNHKGRDWDRIYIDDIDQLDSDKQNILIQNITIYAKYMMVSSIEKPTDKFLNWNLITLPPRRPMPEPGTISYQ